jgi:hypothetical protein
MSLPQFGSPSDDAEIELDLKDIIKGEPEKSEKIDADYSKVKIFKKSKLPNNNENETKLDPIPLKKTVNK